MAIHTEAIVIYGDYATGKTLNAQAFSKFYRKSKIVEEWDGKTPLTPQSLALVNITLTPLDKGVYDYLFIDIETAKETLVKNGFDIIDPVKGDRL